MPELFHRRMNSVQTYDDYALSSVLVVLLLWEQLFHNIWLTRSFALAQRLLKREGRGAQSGYQAYMLGSKNITGKKDSPVQRLC